MNAQRTTDRDQQDEHNGSATAQKKTKTWWERVTGIAHRVIGHAGPDRDAFLLILKSVIAATVAWVIANDLLGAPSATFAPFTALLMVQATISQSLDQSARYAGAMVFGVVLAGFLTPLLGAATLTFAVLIMIALLLGRWRKLGQQGPQVGVAALFAYSSFTQSGGSAASFLQLASIAGLVLLGCALGIITNLVIVPPMRYRSAEYGINSLARSMCDLLTDITQGIEDGVPERNQAEAWRHRANQFPDTVAQARSAVEHAAETMRFNPRRLLLRNSTSFEGHRTIINALERATEQLRSATRGLTYTNSTDHPREAEHGRFLATYGQVLSAVAEAARVLGELHSAEDTEHAEQLDDATDRARQAYQELADQAGDQELDSPEQWPVYGALQTDAHRLVGEFVQAKQNLDQLMDTTEDDPTEDNESSDGGSAEGGSGETEFSASET